MNDLNAQQIVLLTLLVSFVTSIATGIVTVSLLEQAPEPVTQTINRVVEKTIERVVTEPAENDDDEPVEKEIITVVVNEEDKTIEAIEKNSSSVVRIFEQVGDLRNFSALGVIISGDGEIVTDTSRIKDSGDYVGVYQSGEFPLKISYKEADSLFARLTINEVELGTTTVPQFAAADFANSDTVKLGQSVISLSGQSGNMVSTGVITEITKTETENAINTSVNSGNVLAGSILLNLSGEIVGAKINGDITKLSSFMPSNVIKSFLSTPVGINN